MRISPEFAEELDISKPKSPLGLAIFEVFYSLKGQYSLSAYRRD